MVLITLSLSKMQSPIVPNCPVCKLPCSEHDSTVSRRTNSSVTYYNYYKCVNGHTYYVHEEEDGTVLLYVIEPNDSGCGCGK